MSGSMTGRLGNTRKGVNQSFQSMTYIYVGCKACDRETGTRRKCLAALWLNKKFSFAKRGESPRRGMREIRITRSA